MFHVILSAVSVLIWIILLRRKERHSTVKKLNTDIEITKETNSLPVVPVHIYPCPYKLPQYQIDENFDGIPASAFIFDQNHETDILGNCWSVVVINSECLDSRIKNEYPNTLSKHMRICIAGSDKCPDPVSLQKLNDILKCLYEHLSELNTKMKFNPPEDSWTLEAIWLPFQLEEIYYFEFESYYGEPYQLCSTINHSEARRIWVSSIWADPDSNASVIPALKDALRNLKDHGCGSVHLRIIEEYLRNNITNGQELILPITKLYLKNSQLLQCEDHFINEQLAGIQIHSTPTNRELLDLLNDATEANGLS